MRNNFFFFPDKKGSAATRQGLVNRYCKCNDLACNCCRDFSLPVVSIKGPGCASISYQNGDSMRLTMTFGNRVLRNITLSGRKPRPVCMSLPGGISKFCGRIYGIERLGDRQFKACLALELRALDDVEAALRVSCFNFGPQGIKLEPGTPYPISTSDEDDDDDYDDDDDDDDFGLDDDDEDDDSAENDVESPEYEGFSFLGDDFLDGFFGGSSGAQRPLPNNPPKRKPLKTRPQNTVSAVTAAAQKVTSFTTKAAPTPQQSTTAASVTAASTTAPATKVASSASTSTTSASSTAAFTKAVSTTTAPPTSTVPTTVSSSIAAFTTSVPKTEAVTASEPQTAASVSETAVSPMETPIRIANPDTPPEEAAPIVSSPTGSKLTTLLPVETVPDATVLSNFGTTLSDEASVQEYTANTAPDTAATPAEISTEYDTTDKAETAADTAPVLNTDSEADDAVAFTPTEAGPTTASRDDNVTQNGPEAEGEPAETDETEDAEQSERAIWERFPGLYSLVRHPQPNRPWTPHARSARTHRRMRI
ncbi:hypothetical protein AAG570_013133 [Ranatra chinensis]|uniref:DUF4773 domain-containing protein n=1 Tax=Ranatra chinensis TaxID=642074 RepID=A0ABD0YG24_9HEMI